jgi:hypothetical protein
VFRERFFLWCTPPPLRSRKGGPVSSGKCNGGGDRLRRQGRPGCGTVRHVGEVRGRWWSRLFGGGAALRPWPCAGAADCRRSPVGVALPLARWCMRRRAGGGSCLRGLLGGPVWRACARRRSQEWTCRLQRGGAAPSRDACARCAAGGGPASSGAGRPCALGRVRERRVARGIAPAWRRRRGHWFVRRETGGRSCVRRLLGGPDWRAFPCSVTRERDSSAAARRGRGIERRVARGVRAVRRRIFGLGRPCAPGRIRGAAGCRRHRAGVALPLGQWPVRRETGGHLCSPSSCGPVWRACARRRTREGDVPAAARPGRATE